MSAGELKLLGPALLGRLPKSVRLPRYDRSGLTAGMAHIGVGAFHRSHQAEYTDDLLAEKFDRWGVVGINIRDPRLSGTLGSQSGLYTRLIRDDDRVEARVIGSIVSVVDSQASAEPALEVLASPDIDLVTLTVTEKGYCHRPASGALDVTLPDVVHDLANPEAPRSLPGIVVRALAMRMRTHGRPLTVMSCDNIPSNGAILKSVVGAMADRRDAHLAAWIEANAAFPSTMVDRIAPAPTAADSETVEREFGYRDAAVVVGEPFRQWVIENRFAGRAPEWNRVGATLVDDVTAFEHLKMRVLNGAQSTLAYLGVLGGFEFSFQSVADPLLSAFVRRMLVEETLPTLEPVPGMDAGRYVGQSLARLRNTAIHHRSHQIATDGSQKIVQRVLNPIAERLGRDEDIALLAVPVAGWMAYLTLASERFGRRWPVEDPYAGHVAAIADRIGRDPVRLVEEVVAIDTIFSRELAASAVFRSAVAEALDGLLSADPLAYVRIVMDRSAPGRLNRRRQTG
jgi:fructuronate reductase